MNTKVFLTSLASVAALSVGLATSASAATTITGEVSSISYHDADPGLVITASPIAFPTFDLSGVGAYQDFNVLTIGTREGSVNTDFLSLFGEDTVPYPITVGFTFSNPAGTTGAPVSGSTFGFIAPFTSCGVIAGGCGKVDWGSPSIFEFGNGGKFSVELSDAVFGTPGTATVKGRFTLLAESVAGGVPEPATWAMLILGFGMTGAAMRRRSRPSVRYNFA